MSLPYVFVLAQQEDMKTKEVQMLYLGETPYDCVRQFERKVNEHYSFLPNVAIYKRSTETQSMDAVLVLMENGEKAERRKWYDYTLDAFIDL